MTQTDAIPAPAVPPCQAPAHVELTEYLFAQTAAEYAHAGHTVAEIREHMRGAMRLARFTVFNWLISNGVSIPAELLADRTHPAVGQQAPDQQVRPLVKTIADGV